MTRPTAPGHRAARAARRRGWLVLLVAVLALGASVAVRPPHAPPLYDGIGFPDEPYRWVQPPPGQPRTAAAPTPARATVSVTAGADGPVSAASRGFSSEQGPQVALAVNPGAFALPAGVRAVELTATPEAVPDVEPADGTVVSNLYRLTASADGTAGADVPLAPDGVVVVNLRAYAATRQAVVLCTWDGSAWHQVPTKQVGTEIYAAELTRIGPFALVRLDVGVAPTVAAPTPSASAGGSGDVASGSGGASGSSGASGGTLLLVVGGVVVLLAGALLVLRRGAGADAGVATDGTSDGTGDPGGTTGAADRDTRDEGTTP